MSLHLQSGDRLINMIKVYIREAIKDRAMKVTAAIWNSAETVDSNLSSITIDGEVHRWVQKHQHVTGLTAGDLIHVIYGPGTPLTIIGKISGDITLAESDD